MSDAPTRQRILDHAMRLFGENGYAATTIAMIEAAAGLSPGSGAVYRHFDSKKEILAGGVRRQIEANQELLRQLANGPPEPPDPAALRAELTATAAAGLRRLQEEADLNRLLLRDLRHHPELLAEVRDKDLTPVRLGLTAWLRQRGAADLDAEALATVLAGATSQYWILADIFGEHPSGISEDRYLSMLVQMAEALLRS